MWKFSKKQKTPGGFSKLDYFGITIVVITILVCIVYLIFGELLSY